ncbi:MAG: amino acid ABC transporter ATP-binding protein [Alphaproteobacteria bacterium]|nr:amino acid ABC transporter ATP-binding protein [Alphaproteobacteria bacterium]
MIEITALKKSYDARTIIDGITLSVPKGTVCGVLGPSGSGKSTLLRCVNFLEPYEGGEIRVDGELVGYELDNGRRALKPRREIARMRSECCMVFQQFNLFSHMAALDNVAIALVKVRGLKAPEAREKAEALLAKVGLSNRKDAYPAFLSGGEQQRVAIARALAMQPKVLLLDEVTSALDPERAAEVLDVIATLGREGMTMMMVTHQVHFAREVCRHMVFLDEGRIVEDGGPDMLARPKTQRLRSFLRHLRLA